MPRQIEFTQEVADAICERLIEGRSMRSICADDDMPSTSTVCKWLGLVPAFAEQYARAREFQADTLADETTYIADTPMVGVETVTKADGSKETREGDMLGHRRLQVETRKWFASKLAPKKYGDRTVIAGDKDAPLHSVTHVVPVEALDPGARDALRAALEATAAPSSEA